MQKAADKYLAEIKKNVERELETMEKAFDASLSGKGKFDINNLDVTMGNIIRSNQETTESLIGEAAGKGFEAKLLKKKRKECEAVNAAYHNKGREAIRRGTFAPKALGGVCRILLSYGYVMINRSVIEIENAGVKAKDEKKVMRVMPLDEYLHIEDLPFKASALAMDRCARLGQMGLPYKAVEKLFTNELHITVSDSYIHDITDYVGSLAYEEDVKAARVWRKMYKRGKGVALAGDRVGKRGTRKGVYYIMLDGSMLNTRKSDRWEGGWKEVKLALFFAASDAKIQKDRETVKITKKDHAVWLGNIDDFYYQVMEAAVRNHCFEYEQIVVISDGAAWIRKMCEELFPYAVQILDIWHMAENVYAYARYKFNDDESQYKPWAEARIDFMRAGRWKDVLYSLKDIKGKKFPVGVPNLYTYVWNNRKKTNYAEYKANGGYIGSGPMESSNKTAVQMRMKQSGMHWDCIEARHLLALRTRASADRWGEVTEKIVNPAA
jgi:hypothetical protein